MGRMPEVGDVIDDVFRIEGELDSGNFGSVYRVRDLLEQRTLALKVLRPGTHDEDELRRRFEREARLIYSLRHPHVVQVFYYGQTPTGLPYLAMEYLQGTELRSLLQQHGALHPALARRVTMEALSALSAAHALGIIHRDLKPANIFLVNDGAKGHVKVLDFGFAKAFEDEQGADLTNAGTLVGTPAYMAPELVHKKNVGASADLYAMGLILAEMLTGSKIITIDNVYDTILFQASSKPVKLPDELQRGPFGKIIKRAVAKDIKKRYATAEEFMQELAELSLPGQAHEDLTPSLPQPPPQDHPYDDTATRPRSYGMPSIDEVDRALGQSPSAPVLSTKPNPRQTGPGFAPVAISGTSTVPTGAHPVVHSSPERQRVRVQTQSMTMPSPGQEPLDSQQFILGSGYDPLHQGADAGRGARQEHTIELDQERPLDYRPTPQASPSHAREVMIGVAVGGAVVVLILAYLHFFGL